MPITSNMPITSTMPQKDVMESSANNMAAYNANAADNNANAADNNMAVVPKKTKQKKNKGVKASDTNAVANAVASDTNAVANAVASDTNAVASDTNAVADAVASDTNAANAVADAIASDVSDVANADADAASNADADAAEDGAAPTHVKDKPKKRGRKPKGGKIVLNTPEVDEKKQVTHNIILHLKCGQKDLLETQETDVDDATAVEAFQFNSQNFLNINYIPTPPNEVTREEQECLEDTPNLREIWQKVKELKYMLHMNNLTDKKSACFWCTCPFDNPPIFIPKHVLSGSYYCYGCFCSPECAAAFLFKENIDSSSLFERYQLLNHIYGKVYNYSRNIKPAPNPFYLLSKFYGNLSIQEYRRLLTHERFLLIVEKPLARTLPELHEDCTDPFLPSQTTASTGKYKLRKKNMQTKKALLHQNFNLNSTT